MRFYFKLASRKVYLSIKGMVEYILHDLLLHMFISIAWIFVWLQDEWINTFYKWYLPEIFSICEIVWNSGLQSFCISFNVELLSVETDLCLDVNIISRNTSLGMGKKDFCTAHLLVIDSNCEGLKQWLEILPSCNVLS